VQVRIDYRTATCSLFAPEKFAKGDVATFLSVYEAKKEEKVLCYDNAKSHICCITKIRRGEEIVVNYELVDAGDPLNLLVDRVVHSKHKDKAMGRIVGLKRKGLVSFWILSSKERRRAGSAGEAK
jgi:hypothetical protein